MLCFANDGIIDLDAALLLGVNAKVADSPIGYFGTGLKFAIATLLRTGHTVTIFQGTTPRHLSVREKQTRNTIYAQVYLDDAPLGFTTALGRKWEVWQAFRELYSNTLDEPNGEVYTGAACPEEGKTLIWVGGFAIQHVWDNRRDYILDPTHKLRDLSRDVECYSGKGIFVRGILVEATPDSTFAYNFTSNRSLTEDRTLADSWGAHYDICSAILDSIPTTRAIISHTTAQELTWTWPTQKSFTPEAEKAFRAIPYDNLPDPLRKLHKAAVATISVDKWLELHPEQVVAVASAWEVLAPLGVQPRFSVRLLLIADPNVLGRARDGVIGLSPSLFADSLPRIASTLLEEYIHLEMGVGDYSRRMQDVLLEMAVKGALCAKGANA